MGLHPLVVERLAAAFCRHPETAADNWRQVLGHRWRWLGPLAARCRQQFPHPNPRLRDVAAFLRADAGWRQATLDYGDKIRIADWRLPAAHFESPFACPPLATQGDLLHWLHLSAGELEWFAEHWREQVRPHYHCRMVPKARGGFRLIEAPKHRLKHIQRRILDELLQPIPAHPAAHGFVPGRGVHTFAAAHTGQRAVLRMDLENFFPSIGRARVEGVFRTSGYPEEVAQKLAGLCTTITPRKCFAGLGRDVRRAAEGLYCRRHLPQGAPSSPALANLCAYRLDCRLAGLARSVGANYSRYADDLVFSGGADFRERVERLSDSVAAIARDEGFAINHRKTRIAGQACSQKIAGLLVNEKLNVPRADYDQLKAILTNCRRSGPASQNREALPDFRAHLEGRVGWVASVNPARGAKLRALLAAIDWSSV